MMARLGSVWLGLLFTAMLCAARADTGVLLLGVASRYYGPQDAVGSAPTAWYGLRAVSAAYAKTAGQLVNISRTSDNQTCDLLASVNGGVGNTANCSGSANGQSASVFCASTTCQVTEIYDQSGNANHATQTTAANRPTLAVTGCNGLPCLQFNGTTAYLVSANTAALTQPYSVEAVAERTGECSANDCELLTNYAAGPAAGFLFSFTGPANNIGVWAGGTGTTAISATASINVLHVAQGILSGTSSIASLDCTDGSVNGGSDNAGAVSDKFYIGATYAVTGPMIGYIGETGVWPTTTNRTTLGHNAFSWWSTVAGC